MKNLFYTWTAILIVFLSIIIVFFSKVEKVTLFGVDIFTITRVDSEPIVEYKDNSNLATNDNTKYTKIKIEDLTTGYKLLYNSAEKVYYIDINDTRLSYNYVYNKTGDLYEVDSYTFKGIHDKEYAVMYYNFLIKNPKVEIQMFYYAEDKTYLFGNLFDYQYHPFYKLSKSL